MYYVLYITTSISRPCQPPPSGGCPSPTPWCGPPPLAPAGGGPPCWSPWRRSSGEGYPGISRHTHTLGIRSPLAPHNAGSTPGLANCFLGQIYRHHGRGTDSLVRNRHASGVRRGYQLAFSSNLQT